MVERYHNKYRVPSARALWWDYTKQGLYFVTICTKYRERFFGDICEGEMRLSEIGEIVEKEWLKTFELRPDMNLTMCEYVVMPNHFHAVIGIGENEYNMEDGVGDIGDVGIGDVGVGVGRDAMHCVSTDGTAPPFNRFGPQSKNLASIIRGFKIGVARNARLINPDFAWQSRFHDHIIRNQDSYIRIADYILNNPGRWEEDKFYSKNPLD